MARISRVAILVGLCFSIGYLAALQSSCFLPSSEKDTAVSDNSLTTTSQTEKVIPQQQTVPSPPPSVLQPQETSTMNEKVQPPPPAVQEGSSSTNQKKNTWPSFFDDVLRRNFDPRIVSAMYDDAVLNDAIAWAARYPSLVPLNDPNTPQAAGTSTAVPSNYLVFDEFDWHPPKGVGAEPPIVTRAFLHVDDQVETIQKMLSIGLSQLRGDANLQRMFDEAEGSGEEKLTRVRSSLKKVIDSYISIMRTALQVISDYADPQDRSRNLLEKMQKQRAARRTSESEATAQGEPSEWIVYDTPPWAAQTPLEGKYWSSLRPVVQCSRLVRLCEIPDGCRLLCNPDHLTSVADTDGGLHFVGFGSNNQYDWEISLVRQFGTNRISSMTIFDCSLQMHNQSDSRFWRIDPILLNHPMGFGFASECADQVPSPSSLAMNNIRLVLTRSLATPDPETQFKMVPVFVSGEEKKFVGRSGSIPAKATVIMRYAIPQGRPPMKRIHIFKIDVEWYEISVVSSWLRDHLRDMAAHRVKRDDGIIEMNEQSDFFPIDAVQIEWHRIGESSVASPSTGNAPSLRAHFFILQMAALGFIMVGNEPNYFGHCCYEFSFVHSRYFIESEVAAVKYVLPETSTMNEKVQPPPPAVQEGSSSTNQKKNTWPSFFDDVLRRNFDPRIVSAMYDDAVLNDAIAWALNSDTSDFLRLEDFAWAAKEEDPNSNYCQAKMLKHNCTSWHAQKRDLRPLVIQLETVQKMLSIGLAQLRGDVHLQRLLDRVLTVNNGSVTLERSLRRVLAGFMDVMKISLQQIHRVRDATSKGENYLKKMQLQMAARRGRPFNDQGSDQGEPQEWITYDNGLWPAEFQPNEWWYWMPLRPVLQCSRLVRLCELPRGCRWICNPDYLTSVADTDGGLHIVGFGSDNKHDWEISLVRQFGTNRISSMTIFDCTVTGDPRQQWPMPKSVRSLGFAKECLDSRETSATIRIKNLRTVLHQSLASPTEQKQISFAEVPVKVSATKDTKVMRYLLDADVGKTLKRIHVMKVAINGNENFAVQSWLRDHLRDLSVNHVKRDDGIIEMNEQSDFLPIDAVQIDFHRLGGDAEVPSALSSQEFILQMAALGYLMVGQEYYGSNCCFEFVFVHYRFFLESEVWMERLTDGGGKQHK